MITIAFAFTTDTAHTVADEDDELHEISSTLNTLTPENDDYVDINDVDLKEIGNNGTLCRSRQRGRRRGYRCGRYCRLGHRRRNGSKVGKCGKRGRSYGSSRRGYGKHAKEALDDTVHGNLDIYNINPNGSVRTDGQLDKNVSSPSLRRNHRKKNVKLCLLNKQKKKKELKDNLNNAGDVML